MPKKSPKVTPQSKRRDSMWTPRQILARLLGRVAMMLIVLGIVSPFIGDPTRQGKAPVAVCMVAVGVALAFVAAQLKKT